MQSPSDLLLCSAQRVFLTLLGLGCSPPLLELMNVQCVEGFRIMSAQNGSVVSLLEAVAEIGEIPILSVANSSSITKVKNEELDDFNPLVFSGRLESPPTFKADEASWADFKSPKTKLVLDCVFINPSSAICAENDTQVALAKLKAMQN
ncbi:hypothetical protein EV361DRAFT_874883, partial [Lentinula raphanica]